MHFVLIWHGCTPERKEKSDTGAKPIDVILVVKMLILQHRYNFAKEGIENQARDRLPCMHFLRLQPEDRYLTPKWPGCSGEQLRDLKLIEVLFDRFHEQLASHGYVARAGQMVAPTFVELSRQISHREENARIKEYLNLVEFVDL